MICSNCGNTLLDGVKFCSKCGCAVPLEDVGNKSRENTVCCICGSDLMENSTILFMNKNGVCKEICTKCAKDVEYIENSIDCNAISGAVNRLKRLLNNISDAEVKRVVNELVSDGRQRILNFDKDEMSSYKIETGEEDDPALGNSSAWIKGLKTIAWIMFFTIIILGFTIGINLGSETNGGVGFIICFISIVCAFISVAGIMVFLDMAEDIKTIRNELKNK